MLDIAAARVPTTEIAKAAPPQQPKMFIPSLGRKLADLQAVRLLPGHKAEVLRRRTFLINANRIFRFLFLLGIQPKIRYYQQGMHALIHGHTHKDLVDFATQVQRRHCEHMES